MSILQETWQIAVEPLTARGGGDTKGEKQKREDPPADKGGGGDEDEPDRKRPKFTPREKANFEKLGPPTLVIESSYKGARTQKIDEVQSLTFHQEATLLKPRNGPEPKRLYLFTQEVKDSFESVTENGDPGNSEPLGEFEWDDPFGPPYDDPVVNVSSNGIVFTDDPGFSTDRRIPKGHWLTKFDIYFRWKVVRLTDGALWTSEAVHHSLTCAYKGGAEAPIIHQAAGRRQWTVDFNQ